MFSTPLSIELTRKPRPEIREAMWMIFRDFHGGDRNHFMIRYEENSHYALYFAGDQLVGFTGLRMDLESVQGRDAFLIHIGPTLVLPQYRRRMLLARAGLRLLWRYRRCWWRYDTYVWTQRDQPSSAGRVRELYLSRRQTSGRRVREIREFIGEPRFEDPDRNPRLSLLPSRSVYTYPS